mgnify:CR=1 FL=1
MDVADAAARQLIDERAIAREADEQRVEVSAADIDQALDYVARGEVEAGFVYSTDGGSTWKTLPMGAAGDKNKIYWSSDLSTDFERWKIDLDLPGSFPSFQYKVVYRHGIVGGAAPVEFTLGNTSGIVVPKM